MFGNNKTNTQNSNNPMTGGLNSIVQGTVIEGSVSATSDIRIDGIIRGNLDCKSKVIIGPEGYVEGHITCANAIVEGRFDGTIIVQDSLNVRKTAQIHGEVTTKVLIVEPGGIFDVSCRMGVSQPTSNSGGTAAKSKGKAASGQVKNLKAS